MKKLYILILFIFYCFILNAYNFRFNSSQKIPWLEDPWSDPRALEIGREMYMNDFEIMLENVPLDIANDNEDLIYYLEDIHAYNEDISVTIVKRANVVVYADEHSLYDHTDTVVLIVVGKLKDKYKKED